MTRLYLWDVFQGSIRGTFLSLEMCPIRIHAYSRDVTLQPTQAAVRYTQLITLKNNYRPTKQWSYGLGRGSSRVAGVSRRQGS